MLSEVEKLSIDAFQFCKDLVECLCQLFMDLLDLTNLFLDLTNLFLHMIDLATELGPYVLIFLLDLTLELINFPREPVLDPIDLSLDIVFHVILHVGES